MNPVLLHHPVVKTPLCEPGIFLLPLAFQSEDDVLLLELGGPLLESLHLSVRDTGFLLLGDRNVDLLVNVGDASLHCDS